MYYVIVKKYHEIIIPNDVFAESLKYPFKFLLLVES